MEIPHHIVADFFDGKCSPDQEQAVLLFFENHPSALNEYLHYDRVSEESYDVIDKKTSERLLKQIHQRIQRAKDRKRIFGYGVAAAIISAAAILGGSSILGKQDMAPLAAMPADNNSKMIYVSNNLGSQRKIKLPDNSTVTLYNKSCIGYTNNFSGTERMVILDGEADFKVAPNPKKPFIVLANNVSTKALGTNFKVKANDKKILVQLYEGKVVVWNNSEQGDRKYYLNPNHQVEYMIENNLFVASSFGLGSIKPALSVGNNIQKLDKKTQIIAFQNIALPSVLDKLANTYNVRIEYSAQDLNNIYIIADYSKDESIQKLLQNITTINNLKLVKVANNSYYISR